MNPRFNFGKKLQKPALSKLAYFLGLAVIFSVIFSQYFFPLHNIYRSFIVIYGVPIVFITIISGFVILKKAFRNNLVAIQWGLASWGVALSASYVLDLIILNLLLNLNPDSLVSLNKPTPFAHLGPSLWIMILLSFVVIGPAEEYIFRGFVFGGALRTFPKRHWFVLALLSSALFAFVHFYYFLNFGLASSVIIPDIFAIGLALSIAYYFSGGNLLVPILLHALFDSFGFLSLATSSDIGDNLRLLLIGAGILTAIYLIDKQSSLASSITRKIERSSAATET